MTRISAARISMEDGRVDNAFLKDYGETLVGGASGTNTSSTYTVNCEDGNIHNLILNANCTFTFSNPFSSGTACSITLFLTQDSTGGRTVTWPTSVAWPAGTPPTLSTNHGETDVFSFITLDGGTTWAGFTGGIRYNPALASLSFVASATSTATTITIPASAQTGDLGVLLDYAANSSGTPANSAPSGWTNITTTSGSNARIKVTYKILDASDPGLLITGLADGTANHQKVMFVFRGDIPVSSVTPSTWNQEINTANPTLQTVSASGQTTPLLVIGMAGADGATAAFSTASPAFDATVLTSDSDLIGGYKIYNTSPANHSIDMNDLGTNALASGYLICA